MNATVKADKKIKLTDAQEVALEKFYNANCTGEHLWGRTAPAPTIMALHKMGLVEGKVSESSYRYKGYVISPKISEAGIVLAKQLFGMKWWAELVGAWIDEQREIQRQADIVANAQDIATKLNLKTTFKLSGGLGSYKAINAYRRMTIIVSRPYSGYNQTVLPYSVAIKTDSLGATNYTPEQIDNLSELLDEAATICRVFEDAKI